MMTDRQFTEAVAAELASARFKFPGSDATNAALVEEVGELSKALMYESWSHVEREAVQVAAMAQSWPLKATGLWTHFVQSRT